jgi:multidrug resistance efflux pump
VTEGDVLAQLDDTDAQIQLAQARKPERTSLRRLQPQQKHWQRRNPILIHQDRLEYLTAEVLYWRKKAERADTTDAQTVSQRIRCGKAKRPAKRL